MPRHGSVPELPASISGALADPSQCDGSIVSNIEQLLRDPGTQDVGWKGSHSKPKAPRAAVAKVTSKKVTPVPQGGKAISIREDVRPPLTATDRKRIATTIINVALETLSGVLASTPRSSAATANASGTASSRTVRQTTGANSLAERSVNQLSPRRQPGKPVNGRSIQAKTVEVAAGVTNLAECCHLAFEVLQELTPKSDDWQLENGILAFAARLVQLRLAESAALELVSVRARMTARLARQPLVGLFNHTAQPALDGELFVTLLRFDNSFENEVPLRVAVGYQLQVLRLVCLVKTPAIITAILPLLDVDYPSSPYTLIDQLCTSTRDRNQAAKQLISVAITLMSMCPDSSSEPMPPNIILQLQTLALRLRLHSMLLSGCQESLEKCILQPFAKHLRIYAGSSMTNLSNPVELPRVCWEKIREDLFEKVHFRPSPVTVAGVDDIISQLTLGNGPDHPGDASPTAAQCISLSRRAVTILKQSMNAVPSHVDLQLLGAATAVFSYELSNDETEDNGVIRAAVELRNAASNVVISSGGLHDSSADRGNNTCRTYCQDFLSGFLGFLGRLVQTYSPAETTGSSTESYPRLRFVFDLAKPNITLALKQCTQLDGSQIDDCTWTRTNNDLEQCSSLIQAYNRSSSFSAQVSPAPKQLSLVQVSNAHFRLHIASSKILPGQSLRSLHNACESLRNITEEEKTKGALIAKLAKLARTYREKSQFAECCKAQIWLVEESAKLGVLHGMVAEASSSAISILWSLSSSSQLMFAALDDALQLELQHDLGILSEPLDLENAGLAAAERGLLLERQLHALFKIELSERMMLRLSRMASSLCASLLRLYDPDQHAIARLRVCCQILRMETESSITCHPDQSLEAYNAATVIVQGFNYDAVQVDWHIKHLHATALVALAVKDLSQHSVALPRAIDFWRSMVAEHNQVNDLMTVIGDFDLWLYQLSNLGHILRIDAIHNLHILVLKLISDVEKIGQPQTHRSPAEAFTRLAAQLLWHGYTEEAGFYLEKARREGLSGEHNTNINVHELVMADYHLSLGQVEHCRIALAKALKAHESGAVSGDKHSTTKQKVIRMCNLADYHHISSRLATFSHHYAAALEHAKLNLKVLRGVWSWLDGQRTETQSLGADDLNARLSKLDIEANSTATPKQSSQKPLQSRILLLPIIPRLLRVYKHLATLYYTGGLFLEALSSLSEARRLLDVFNVTLMKAEIFQLQGDYSIRSGQLGSGQQMLDQADSLLKCSDETVTLVAHHQSLGHLHHLQEDWVVELSEYDRAESILRQLATPEFLTKLGKQLPADVNQEHPQSALSSKPAPGTSSRNKSRQQARFKPKGPLKAVVIPNSCTDQRDPSDLPPQFVAFASALQLSRANSFLSQGNLDSCSKMLAMLVDQQHALHSTKQLLQARLLFVQALQVMAKDSVFGMLHECTLSIPGIALSTTRQVGSLPKTSKGQIKPQFSPRGQASATSGFQYSSLLEEVNALLGGLPSSATTNLPGILLSRASFTLCASSMFLSYLRSGVGMKSLHPANVAHTLGFPQNLNALRHRTVLLADKLIKERSPPPLSPIFAKVPDISTLSDSSHMHANFCASIPDKWTIVSLSLDEKSDHLLVTRYLANRYPFIVRLPLARQNEEAGGDTFSYNDGRDELFDIIAQSDLNVHSSRDNPDQLKVEGAKTQWWAEREALNDRMHNLLLNMENMWLGGFRGLLSHAEHSAEHLAKFQQSFDNILAAHLPSRQRSRNKKGAPTIKLDRHIIELFVNLCPKGEPDFDLSECLTDLLYYIVDILQFNGEANAYDEIDFDTIIVETLSALEAYRETDEMDDSTSTARHTILILDKPLHGFPWESLPCLDGRSVSRVPSIVDLHERITAMQAQQRSGPDGMLVSARNGTCILNPGGDLKNTQHRFQNPLTARLFQENDWSSIIDRNPTGEEFTAALSTDLTDTSTTPQNRLLLYFGHGSGEQYITHRRIKALRYKHWTPSPPSRPSSSDSENPTAHPQLSVPPMNPNISVPLLFGCSSAALTLHGEFEPHGTPASYLVAGAPAMLGSLWDVTDGDLDLFAACVLERWGLLTRGTLADGIRKCKGSSGKKAARGGGAGRQEKTHAAEADFGKMSLSDAVGRSRGECYLKYLNGAAMVVYGVPVYLDKERH